MTVSVAAADDFVTQNLDSRRPMDEICESDRDRRLARPYYRIMLNDEDADDDFTCNTGDTTVKRSNCKMPTKEEVKKAKDDVIDYLRGAEAAKVPLKHLIAYTDDLTGSNEALHAKAQEEIAAMLKGKNDKLENEYDSFLKAARVLQEHVASLTPVKSLSTFLTIAKSEADDVAAAAAAVAAAAVAAAGGGTVLKKKEPLLDIIVDPLRDETPTSPANSESTGSVEVSESTSSLPGILQPQAESSDLVYSDSSGTGSERSGNTRLKRIAVNAAEYAAPNLLPGNEGGIGRMFMRLKDCCMLGGETNE